MTVSVDIWLRGTDYATTSAIEDIPHAPAEWTDDDVRLMLEGMLRTMNRLKNPAQAHRGVTLRGLSWIVNPYEEGGVVVAIEITLGAAIAGPIHIDKATLETMITRVLAQPARPTSTTVH